MKRILILVSILGVFAYAQDPQIYRSKWYKDLSKLENQGTVNGLPCYPKDASLVDRGMINGLLYIVWRRDLSYSNPVVWREVYGIESNRLVILRIEQARVTKATFIPEKLEWVE